MATLNTPLIPGQDICDLAYEKGPQGGFWKAWKMSLYNIYIIPGQFIFIYIYIYYITTVRPCYNESVMYVYIIIIKFEPGKLTKLT